MVRNGAAKTVGNNDRCSLLTKTPFLLTYYTFFLHELHTSGSPGHGILLDLPNSINEPIVFTHRVSRS